MSDVVPVRSDCCGLDDLFLAYGTGGAERARLALGPGWPRRWTATWQVPGGAVTCAVRDLVSGPPAGCEPVRRFSWARRQRHRPGLQFMMSTGRLHGFESLEERSLLPGGDPGTVHTILSRHQNACSPALRDTALAITASRTTDRRKPKRTPM